MTADDTRSGRVVLPLHEEDLAVTRQVIETGRVEIGTTVEEREELVDELLRSQGYEVERTPVGERVSSAPGVREEGDTLILPVLEEILVVEKHLLLKEEIRIRRVVTEERHQQTVTLRTERVGVRRSGSD